MTKSKNMRVLVTLVLILGGGLLWTWFATSEEAARRSDVAESKQDPLRKLAALNAERLEKTRARVAGERVVPDAVGSQAQVAERFLDVAFVLHDARNMYNRDELQKGEYDRIAKDPAALALVRKVAVDFKAALELYGEHQAFARTYAVRALGYISQKDPELAGQAVEELGQRLNQQEEWEKGIQHDYVDLLAAYSRALGPKNIMTDPESFMRRVQLTPRTSVEVGRALWDSGVLASISPDQMATLKSVFTRLSNDG